MTALNLGRYMPAVAELLLGTPNSNSSAREWRYGSHGSLAIDIPTGRWFDHEHQQGGGVLDLISREQRCARAEAMTWLLEHVPEAADEAGQASWTNGQAERNGHTKPGKKPPLGRIVATYDYISEHGERLFQVVRFEPKDFRQRRPDPVAPDGWSWSVKGIELVPYRLPALLSATTVLVVEGEKDADRLTAIGLCATTNPGGVGKWPDSFNRWFVGKSVVLLPDNDDAGRKHAQDVVRKLARHASTIKVVTLSDLPLKGDVSDWLDAGGTANALRALIEETPPCRPQTEGLEWSEPIDIIGAPELIGWPILEADCLPKPLYNYVTAEAERLNVDPCPLAAHVIAACATSISDKFTVKPKLHDDYTQQARVWSCVIKSVGGRGTEMINSAFWPLKERNVKLHKQWVVNHAQWEERNPKKKDKNDPEPKPVWVMTSDATVEAISEILKHGNDTSKLGAVYDELVTFLGGFGRYSEKGGGAARGIILEAYDGGPQWIDRIQRGHIYVPNWSLVVAGNIQPRRLAALAPHLIDDGLFQRFLAIHTRPSVLSIEDDKPISPAIRQDYRELHDMLAKMVPVTVDKPMPCYFDADARTERQKFMRLVGRLQADPTLPTIIRETAPKWSGLLARLSLIFHLVELAEQQRSGSELTPEDICRVTVSTVTMAATFLRRIALPNLFRLGFETMPEEGAAAGHARWIAQHILAHHAESITGRDIGRAFRDLRGKVTEIAIAMEILVDTGWVLPVDTRKDGQCWSVNPAVHERFAAAAAEEKARRSAMVELIKTKVEDL